MRNLRDKVAVVTGGSSGIGQMIAVELGKNGSKLADKLISASVLAGQSGMQFWRQNGSNLAAIQQSPYTGRHPG